MSAASFPAFSSFPDLDPGPSTRTVTSAEDKNKDKEGKHRKKVKKDGGDRDPDGERRRQKKHKHEKHGEENGTGAPRRSRSKSRLGPVVNEGYQALDDERKKAEEDRLQRQDGLDAPSTKVGLVYYTDRRGDPMNERYGGLHAGDIPRYRLVDRRKVLGLSPELSVVYRGRAGAEVAPFGRRKMPALTDSASRHMLAAPPKRRLLASTEDKYKYREIDGFLHVSTNHPRKDNQSYREIEISRQGEEDSDESEHSDESASSDSESDTTPMTSLQSTIKALEDRLATDPRDIPCWLSLLSHTLSTVPITTKNASKARAEIALSVLTRAISADPSNRRSVRLRLKYLKAGEEVWQREKLKTEWEDAVKTNDVDIWIAWLDWRVRDASEVLDSIAEDAGRVIKALMVLGDEVGQLRAQWRAAVALKDAGYVERANALLQAQAELLFCMPQRLSTRPFDEQLDALEEFWDSEVARLGELNAKGWAAWEASKPTEQPPPPPARQDVEADPDISDPYARWAASETLADGRFTMSLRSTDDDDNADPFAVVLLSDIQSLLLPLHSERAREAFRRIWLAFAGLHVPGFAASLSAQPKENSDDRWASSHLVSSARLAAVFPAESSTRRIAADSHAGVLIGRERDYGSGFGPVKNWGYGAIAPLDSLGTAKWSMWTSEDIQGVDVSLVREIFKHCRMGADDSPWDVLNLAFEAAVSMKGAIKVSKSLLASARESLPHWGAHARLECLRGRLDDARKVYHTVLVASSQKRSEEATLWWDWAQMEWLARNDDVALQVIIRSSGVAGTGGTATLRAKRHFETLLTQELQRASWRDREPWIKIAGLLELLTSSPQGALSLIDSYLSMLDCGTPAHESLTVASLALLYNHTTVLKNPVPPALLRERVERAVEQYPNNTAIFGMFLEAEKGQAIWGRVRAMLGETAPDGTGKEKGVARRVAEVWVAGWEKGRWVAEAERVRSGLSAAVEDDRTRGSAILWKLYIMFEIRAGQPGRAKKLLLRAVGECPTVKELYLLAFGPLRAEFDARELQQLGDAMAERGVRMRVGLEEVAGAVEDNRESEDSGSEDEDEDEIEARAREERRLRPY